MAGWRSSAFWGPFNWDFCWWIKEKGKLYLVCIKLNLFLSSLFVTEIGDREVLVNLTWNWSFQPDTKSFILGHSFQEKKEVIKLHYEETSVYSVAYKAWGDLMSTSHILASLHLLKYFTEGETASTRAPQSRKFPELLARILGRSQVQFCSCLDWKGEVMNLQLHCLNSHSGGFQALAQCTFGLDKEKHHYKHRPRTVIWVPE